MFVDTAEIDYAAFSLGTDEWSAAINLFNQHMALGLATVARVPNTNAPHTGTEADFSMAKTPTKTKAWRCLCLCQ